MRAKVRSCAIVGRDGTLVEVDIVITNDGPTFSLAGLPEAAIHVIKERVRAAIEQSSFCFPDQSITIHISSSPIQTEQRLVFPIAIGILLVSGQITPEAGVVDALFLGELAADGRIQQSTGILPMVAWARERQCNAVFVPAENAREAALVDGIAIYPVETLAQVGAHLNGERPIEPVTSDPHRHQMLETVSYDQDMATIRGQEPVKRAVEVAVSGHHHLMLCGPPGTQQRLLAQATPSIFPAMTLEEALVVTSIASVNGLISSASPLIVQRPFRAPPPTSCQEDFLGYDQPSWPGEMSLAHEGVLFLDELPAYEPQVQSVLCQAMKQKEGTIAQAGRGLRAHFLLIASMRPCPCGFFTDPMKPCTCSPAEIAHYQGQVSRHLLDCIDIVVEVPRIDEEKLAQKRQAEYSHCIRARVQQARERQRHRFAGTTLTRNAEMEPAAVRTFCQVEPAAEQIFHAAIQHLHLSMPASQRVLKVARTIADLADSDLIAAHHLAEAIQYRPRI